MDAPVKTALLWPAVVTDSNPALLGVEALPESCFNQAFLGPWTPCVNTTTAGKSRVVVSNSVPPFQPAPYCPYGVGGGYCMPHEADCPFAGMVCPMQEGAPADGDVLVPQHMTFTVPLHGFPTNPSAPHTLYVLLMVLQLVVVLLVLLVLVP